MCTQTASAGESLKIMKAELRHTFPGVKFSSRLHRGTATGNCTIQWVDGPSIEAVEKVIGRYEAAGFDGMTDCQYGTGATLPDGRNSGLSLIFPRRDNSRLHAVIRTLMVEHDARAN